MIRCHTHGDPLLAAQPTRLKPRFTRERPGSEAGSLPGQEGEPSRAGQLVLKRCLVSAGRYANDNFLTLAVSHDVVFREITRAYLDFPTPLSPMISIFSVVRMSSSIFPSR